MSKGVFKISNPKGCVKGPLAYPMKLIWVVNLDFAWETCALGLDGRDGTPHSHHPWELCQVDNPRGHNDR